jgi:hypothetical protein
MKFIYVGDPTELKDGTKAGPNQSRQVSYTEPGTGKVTVFPFGEAVEAPKWLADKLAKSNHFKAVDAK